MKYSFPYPYFQFSSVTQLCPTLHSHGLQHARLPCPSPTPAACSNSYPSNRWYHPTISSSVVPFSCLQYFPASVSFLRSQFFTSGDQNIGASASASVFPMNIQDWFSLGLTGLISLQSKGLSRVFSNTTVQKHQFFGAQLSLCKKRKMLLSSLLFSAIGKASSDNHFAFLHFFFLGMFLITTSCIVLRTSSIVFQALCLSDLIPWIYLLLPLFNRKGFDLDHTWML